MIDDDDDAEISEYVAVWTVEDINALASEWEVTAEHAPAFVQRLRELADQIELERDSINQSGIVH